MSLTAKEEKYVQGLVTGLSQRKAYREAYPRSKNWKDRTVDSRASELFKKSNVLGRYNEIMEKHNNKALWTREDAVTTLRWTVDKAIESIEVHDEGYIRQGTANALLGAIKELNALEDIYPDKTQNINLSGSVSNPYDELTADELRALINSE